MGNKTSANASSSARSTEVQLLNDTSYTLEHESSGLQHGIWTKNHKTPKQIEPFESKSWRTESNGIMTGTQGYVYYKINGEKFKLLWNNPFAGSNSYSFTTPKGFIISYTGGSGENCRVCFNITEKKQTNKATKKEPLKQTSEETKTSVETIYPTPGCLKEDKKEKETEKKQESIEEVEEETTCCICHDILMKAHILKCGHTMCHQCVCEWIDESKQNEKVENVQCPICRKEICIEPIPCLALDNIIESVHVKHFSKEEKQEWENRKNEYENWKTELKNSATD
eukprot:454653_1